MSNQYNVLIDCVGFLLLFAILIAERMQKHRDRQRITRTLRVLMLCCAMVFLTDIPGLLLDGQTFPSARALLWLFDSAYWALQVVYCYLWLLFAIDWVYAPRARSKRRALLWAIPMAIELLLIFTTSLTGWVFTIDATNTYVRGCYYGLNMLPYYLYIVAVIVITVIGYRKDADQRRDRRKLSLLVFMFLPILGVLIDALYYGISWLWPMVALSLLMVYLSIQQQISMEWQLADSRRTAHLAEIENELLENRMTIMLSQVQPHFLYNALSTIKALCRRDPPLAERAMDDFTEFLRGNMNSLTAQKPIAFETELEHTRHYLSLEKLRFQEYLHVEYDIQATRFRLPTLTMQPIVENAVRHGVTKREEGGTVTISTRETDGAFLILVKDDGIGFDPSIANDDRRSHIGIANVRNRLDKLCGGTLVIESVPNVGTVAAITIPKE